MSYSLSEVQTQHGGTNPVSMSEYYKGGSYIPTGYTYSNYGTRLSGTHAGSVPSSGAISMSQFQTTSEASVWADGSGSPVVTPYGNNVYSAYKPLSELLPASERATGSTVWVCIYVTGDWTRYRHMTSTITVGTSKTFTTPYYPDKTYYGQCIYDGGGNQLRLRGYYSGPSTGSPNGRIYLEGIGGMK